MAVLSEKQKPWILSGVAALFALTSFVANSTTVVDWVAKHRVAKAAISSPPPVVARPEPPTTGANGSSEALGVLPAPQPTSEANRLSAPAQPTPTPLIVAHDAVPQGPYRPSQEPSHLLDLPNVAKQ